MELQARIDEKLRNGYTGATTSVARIRELAKRFDPIVLPGTLEVNSGPPHSLEQSVEEVLDYIFSFSENPVVA